jgi:hypothetical protein
LPMLNYFLRVANLGLKLCTRDYQEESRANHRLEPRAILRLRS